MAVIQSKNVIELSGTIANFDLGCERPIKSISFEPGAASDILVVRDESSAGPRLFEVSASDTHDQRVMYFNNALLHPVITVSQCTFTAGTKIVFILGA